LEQEVSLDEVRYSVEHLWVSVDDDNLATIGLSERAYEEWYEIEQINLPTEGEDIVKDERFGRIVNTRLGEIQLYAPISGEVTEINEEVRLAPELILEDPYVDGWLIRVELTNPPEFDDLLTSDEYNDFLGEKDEDEESDLDDDEDDF